MDEYKEHYCKLTNTVATDPIKLQIKTPPLPSSLQIVEIGRSTPWNLYCTSMAPWHERLNNSFLQLLQLHIKYRWKYHHWKATTHISYSESVQSTTLPYPLWPNIKIIVYTEILIQEILTKALQFPPPPPPSSTFYVVILKHTSLFDRSKGSWIKR